MQTFTFALPTSYDQYCVKTFTRKVKTKTFVKQYKAQLSNTASRLTTAGVDNRQVIGGMLQIAYGANIGRQVEQSLTDADITKIRNNIISAVYS